MTVSELITNALGRIGVTAEGITPSAETTDTGLTALNDLADAWAAEKLTLYGETRTTWTIVSGTSSYDVGAGQAINRVRPVFVWSAGSISPWRYYDTAQTTPVELPLTPLTDAGWRGIGLKTLTSVLPSSAYYNPTFPYGNVQIWPVPTSSTLIGVLYAPTAMTAFALVDTISLPPGYRRFLTTNLALELCPAFDVFPTPLLVKQAMDAKAAIERANMRLVDLSVDLMWAGRTAGYNIYSDLPSGRR